jgi:hypothetical protein
MTSNSNNCVVSDSHIVWMFRYCVVRSGPAVNDGADAIINNWNVLGDGTKVLIVREIIEAFDRHGEIMRSYDRDAWEAVLNLARNDGMTIPKSYNEFVPKVVQA